MNETPTPQGQSRSETGGTERDEQIARELWEDLGRNADATTGGQEGIYFGFDNGLQIIREHLTRANKARDEQSAPAAERVLESEWRHSNGMLFCGTMRIAKADFDTDPAPDFKERVFDDICNALNAPSPAQEKPRPTASSACAVCRMTLIDHRLHPELFDHEFSYELPAQEKPLEASVGKWSVERINNFPPIASIKSESGYVLFRGISEADAKEVCDAHNRVLATASPSEDTKRLNQLLVWMLFAGATLRHTGTHYELTFRAKTDGEKWATYTGQTATEAIDAAMSSPSVTQTEISATPPTLSAQERQSQETDGVDWQDLAIRARTELELLHMNWGLIVKHFGDAKDFEYRETSHNAVCQAIYDAQKPRNLSPSEPAGRAGSVEAEAKSVSTTPEEKQ
jgi:hypothetical protein